MDLTDLNRICRERAETGAHGDAHIRVGPATYAMLLKIESERSPWDPTTPNADCSEWIECRVTPGLGVGTWQLVANDDGQVRGSGQIHLSGAGSTTNPFGGIDHE